MLLETLEAENFRNIHGKIVCGKNLNIFFGENGQGKTNWLEAIYLLATTKSFKTARLQEAIKFDEKLAIVRGRVHQGEDINRVLQVALEGNTKDLSVNNKKETVQRFLGQLHAVNFNSDELEIVRGTPDARRKFLDGGIVSIYPPFVQTLTIIIASFGRKIRFCNQRNRANFRSKKSPNCSNLGMNNSSFTPHAFTKRVCVMSKDCRKF